MTKTAFPAATWPESRIAAAPLAADCMPLPSGLTQDEIRRIILDLMG